MNPSLIILLFSIIVSSFSQILLKKSAAKTWPSPLREYLNPYVICGYGMLFFSLFLTVLAYRELDFTNIPVMESAGYVIVMILSFFFFREKFTRRKVLGMLLILSGIVIYHL